MWQNNNLWKTDARAELYVLISAFFLLLFTIASLLLTLPGFLYSVFALLALIRLWDLVLVNSYVALIHNPPTDRFRTLFLAAVNFGTLILCFYLINLAVWRNYFPGAEMATNSELLRVSIANAISRPVGYANLDRLEWIFVFEKLTLVWFTVVVIVYVIQSGKVDVSQPSPRITRVGTSKVTCLGTVIGAAVGLVGILIGARALDITSNWYLGPFYNRQIDRFETAGLQLRPIVNYPHNEKMTWHRQEELIRLVYLPLRTYGDNRVRAMAERLAGFYDKVLYVVAEGKVTTLGEFFCGDPVVDACGCKDSDQRLGLKRGVPTDDERLRSLQNGNRLEQCQAAIQILTELRALGSSLDGAIVDNLRDPVPRK